MARSLFSRLFSRRPEADKVPVVGDDTAKSLRDDTPETPEYAPADTPEPASGEDIDPNVIATDDLGEGHAGEDADVVAGESESPDDNEGPVPAEADDNTAARDVDTIDQAHVETALDTSAERDYSGVDDGDDPAVVGDNPALEPDDESGGQELAAITTTRHGQGRHHYNREHEHVDRRDIMRLIDNPATARAGLKLLRARALCLTPVGPGETRSNYVWAKSSDSDTIAAAVRGRDVSRLRTVGEFILGGPSGACLVAVSPADDSPKGNVRFVVTTLSGTKETFTTPVTGSESLYLYLADAVVGHDPENHTTSGSGGAMTPSGVDAGVLAGVEFERGNTIDVDAAAHQDTPGAVSDDAVAAVQDALDARDERARRGEETTIETKERVLDTADTPAGGSSKLDISKHR